MGKAKITRHPAFDRLRKAMKDMNGASVRAGWFQGNQYPDGTPVAYVAAIQNHGAPAVGIPPRPFMEPTIERDANDWQKLIESFPKAIADGKLTARQALDRLGLSAQGGIQQSIEDVHTPILAEETIRQRAKRKNQTVNAVSVKPLEDTGHMLRTTSYEVKQ